MSSPHPIDQMMEQAIERGVFPAASLLVGHHGDILHEGNYGEARGGVYFDVASLTKPVSTTTLVMQLVQEDLLHLDDTLQQWLPKATAPQHKEITLTHLLSHTSGLPAWHPFYRELPLDQVGTPEGKQHIVSACLEEQIISKPGSQCTYSDLGFILLGEIVEQAGYASLDALFQNRIARPLEMKDTFFTHNIGLTPKDDKSAVSDPWSLTHQKRFAPTEDCPWRKHVIQGEVHDPNAYAMGGVAGHAGVFSTTEDLHRFIKTMINCYHGKSDWIDPKIVQQFFDFNASTPKHFGTYELGWDTPTFGQSSAGRYFSPHSVGHLGYTGCSMWIDLDKDFWAILLSNRIHPDATNEKIKAFRPRIHNLICKTFLSF